MSMRVDREKGFVPVRVRVRTGQDVRAAGEQVNALARQSPQQVVTGWFDACHIPQEEEDGFPSRYRLIAARSDDFDAVARKLAIDGDDRS